ncbi:ciliogenesis and planar polarity effector 1 isoform X6 [Malaclemys terrapin pileata]|uniref:ciliogenesis and planar polarity effector 1 isoform X6 n=1 Tax=Malaclemys terrapin pileata TaxID=2991368 RepID=UPI0023A81DC8|nr:ciliogenesis and planar polarity effector 1 isoform X6 [Malaclemys terrapin pileata]
MEIKLDVLVSTCIKHRKPWPRISWLGQEKESIFLLDDKCISEINLLSGKTKKKIPRLQSLLKNVVVLATSRNGAWLAGIVTTGELFLWNKDQDYLKIVPAVEESSKVVTAAQECSMRLYLYVSGDGNKVLLITPTACIFLWESTECKNISSPKNPSLAGRWTQIVPEESILLPSSEDKETGMSADFIKNEILGDCCLCSFVFYSGERLMLTFLALRWHENSFKYISSLPYHIHWAQQACSLPTLVPVCVSVKSRGALLTAFSRDGLLLAVAINQNDPKATQILFINTLNFVTVSGSLKGCSSKNHVVPSKFVRSYWVGDMSWTLDSLFLACMLKRGSLILLTCMGELLTLVTSGCSIEFGPAEFIPFHPLITYRLQQSVSQDSSHSLGSSASESDLMRQRFSVTSHSRLPYLIVSDGYMVTVLRFSDNLLPSGVMRSLLLDSAQRLEKIHQSLMTPKSKGKRLQLRSLSSLKASLLKQHRNQNSTLSTIPKFLLLQEEETAELSEKAADLQDYEDKSDDDKQFQNNSSTFCSQGPNSFFSKADQGRLEFASMFDTVHAKDDTDAKDDLSTELNSIQKNLLAAWGIGISKNVQEKDMLLNYTIGCITHLFNILQFIKSPLLTHDAFLNKSEKYKLWMHAILKHFQQCLTVLYWDVRDRQTVGHLVKLTSQTVKLMLIQHQDQLFSEYLLGCFCLLKMVAHSLNGKFTPCYEIMSASSDVNSAVELDSLIVPIFQVLDGSSAQKFRSLNSLVKIPPQAVKLGEKPENRLMILWRLLYKQVLQYQTQLNRKISKDGKSLTEMKIAHEESIVAQLLGHIQAVLQSSGETLEQTRKLNSVIGEEQFLLGSYEESVDLWKRALQETKAKGEKRTQFLQTRYYLAILYCHLYHYNLTEAQGLSDHLVREILRRSQLSVRQIEDFSDAEYSQYELWMIRDVHPEAAMAVIQSMARFMAAYFTNQLLYILPPHKVDILPPLHINQDRFPRVVPLQHSVVTSAVRDQNLSSVWTAEYALDLLFVGGLIPEAVWLAHKLGDWKMSVSIGVAYNLYCQSGGDLRSEKTELHLPLNLTPTQIFQEKLQSFLGQPVSFETSNEERTKYKQFTDPIEEEDANVLFGSVQEILKAAVMADADILSETFQLLIDSAKDLTRKLCGLVPDGLYLPAPPLYCPQPASLSEKDYNDSPLKIERDYRQKVSGVLQRILLLFRAARCSCPVAQWYIVQLKWARKVMQKIRMKGTLPSLSSFPETLLHYSKFSTIFFRPASSGDHRFDDVSCKTIGCFRELCALCWMLHVRERLSDSCRHYQTARESMGNQKDCKKAEYDACIVEHCLNAVEWACRMLPFARFMNVEELVQDIILSLVGELPPIRKVAEILVKAFPNSEDVRVPLRDKYHALQQRLRHCIVRGSKSEEMMSVVIQATHKVRLKVLKRVIRNIGPIEMSIWEPSEEETPDDEAHCYDRFSLGTSLSRSTLSDCGNPQVYSDAETADTLSEALLTEETRNQAPSPQRETRPPAEEQTGSKKTAHKIKYLNWKAKHKEHSKVLPNQHTLPVVGAWEFERDDDEYVKFLDLFLSYMLERDFVNCSDPGIPFLTSFSELLREHELHSLLFDVHTTLKRRQGKTNSQNVFRAGCCYAVTLASCDSKPASLCNEKQKHLENQMSVSVLQPADSSVCDSVNGVKKYMGKEGLFGLNHLSVYRAQDKKQEITITPITQTLSDHACSNIQTSVTCKYVYKTIHVNDVLPREELALELKNKFSNIARLLEWMIRWSDRRLLCDTNKIEPFQESRPMIHVKTSAAAILTSLWLLGRPYCDESQARITSFKSPDYQYLMNSASLPETRPKIQKESSMDTGRSPATEMPHAVQDVNAYDELCENVLGIPTKTKHSEKNEMNESHSVTHSTEEGVIGFDEEVGAFLQEEVDATSENEELFEEPFGVPKSPSISVSIKPVQQQKEEHISTLDVESPWEEPMMEKLEEKKAKQNGMTEAVSGTIPHSFCLEMNADAPSVPYNGPVCSKKQVVQEGEQISEPLNVSEAVRQMLQDEMFKLVQLQQINFLNLMQMVGSSFASLPNMQHLLQQSQSIQLGGSQALHTVRGSGADTSLPIQSADISPETQLPTKENAGKSNKKSSSHSQERNILNDQSSKESIHFQPPKLIPIQNLIAFEQSRQCTSAPHDFIGQDHSGQIELLKVNTEPFDARHTKNNTKRQKRRAEKQIKEKEDKKKPSVTFHPDDFIISTDDIERVFETEIQDQQAESSRYLEDDFVISLDTVGETITTTAGLHCMASTRKKPAETQDASTNTDPVLKSYQDIETGSEDKTVSELSKHQPIASVPSTEHLASRVPQMLPPDMYLNFKFHTEVGESLLPSSVSDTAPDLIGHKYINVIDIEDSDLFKDLPTIAESTEEMVTTQQHENFEVPSSAKLHHMAASVTNAIPPNEFQGKDDHQNGLFPVQERDVKSDAARDNLTWNLLHEDVSIIHSTGLSAKIISKEHFNTKLQEMDIQLQALQNIAENMEKDFSNTKLIVKTIEDLGMAASPNLGVASLFSEGVGVIDEARYVSSVDEEEEGSRPEYSVTSYTALQAHSLSPATSSANLLSRIKSSSDIHINEDLGDSFIDNPLQITGLSGITDVIDDLVTEGGISTTELGITKTQARSISRIHDTAAGQSPKTERERKEIQAWMKRKRKERLAEYLKKLDEQREREYNPFNLRNNMQFGLSAKEIKLSQKKKDEKDKALLSEHHNLRVSQALSLMNEMLSETVQLPASELRPLSKTMRFPRDFRKQQLTSARGRPGSRSLSASQAERSRTAAKPDFGQARSHSTPPQGLAQSGGTATVVLQKNISKGRIRNARHYPVNSRQVAIRPQDQTSQVTLRGMLTDFNRRRTRLQGNASQRQGLSKGRPNSARQASDYQTLSTRNLRRPTPCAAAIQREETGLDYESERDSISPWSVPDDIQRLLHDNYDSLLEVSVPHEEDCSPLSINDSVSESTGSILSKLDWNAVEAMVANVEEK